MGSTVKKVQRVSIENGVATSYSNSFMVDIAGWLVMRRCFKGNLEKKMSFFMLFWIDLVRGS